MNDRIQLFLGICIGKRPGKVLFALFILSMSSPDQVAFAFGDTADILDKTRTLALIADYGFTTYKSKAVESNDTGSATRIHAGVQAGDELELGVAFNLESASHTFALNESSITTGFQDIMIHYRLGWCYLGGIISGTAITVNKAGEDISIITGSGYGGLFHLNLPVSKGSIVYVNTDYAMTSKAEDKIADTVTVGPRMNVDIGANVSLNRKSLELIFGYRYQTYAITIDGSSYAELQTATYVGMGWGFNF